MRAVENIFEPTAKAVGGRSLGDAGTGRDGTGRDGTGRRTHALEARAAATSEPRAEAR
jgi:hypothetical protein